MNRFQSGAVAGLLATSPMTYFMFSSEKAKDKIKPLPPARFTAELGGQKIENRAVREMTGLAMHFLFGGAMGSVFGCISKDRSSLMKGILFGTAVWAASYLGWIPILRLKPSAKDMSTRRNIMMIFAHIIWGGFLASAYSTLQLRSKELWDGTKKQNEANA